MCLRECCGRRGPSLWTLCRRVPAAVRLDDPVVMVSPRGGNGDTIAEPYARRDQLTRATSTRLSENVGARPSPQWASDDIEFTDPSERFNERQ